ncbi:hypothetical protein ACQRCQ_03195 [Lachnospiraceae bacterium SGI.085]
MLTLKLKDENENSMVFNYYPENKKLFGTLNLDKKTGDIQIISVSENDSHHRYLQHAVSKIDEYFSSGKYENTATVAWY